MSTSQRRRRIREVFAKCLSPLALIVFYLPVHAQSVTPANQTIAPGQQIQFKLLDATGNDLTASAKFSVSNAAVATITMGGLATGVSNGTVTITGTAPATAPPTPPATTSTSVQLSANPCDVNFNCVSGLTAAVGQTVKITAHVVYVGTVAPTGQLCINIAGSTSNCGLTPVTDENWYTSFPVAGVESISATYAGNTLFSPSSAAAISLAVGTIAPPPPPPPAYTITCSWAKVTQQNNCVIKGVPQHSSVKVQVNPPNGPTATATRP